MLDLEGRSSGVRRSHLVRLGGRIFSSITQATELDL